MKSYTKEQLQEAVSKAIYLIMNHHFPVMASRVWDIYRANYPLCVVTLYWKGRPDNGNPPDFNEMLSVDSRIILIKCENNTYYLVKK